jgi:hypothetical protein
MGLAGVAITNFENKSAINIFLNTKPPHKQNGIENFTKKPRKQVFKVFNTHPKRIMALGLQSEVLDQMYGERAASMANLTALKQRMSLKYKTLMTKFFSCPVSFSRLI